jgi:hypothetical protein
MQISKILTSDKGFKILWEDEKVGYGELTLIKTEDGYTLDTETMGSEFCKKVFAALVDKYIPEEYKD